MYAAPFLPLLAVRARPHVPAKGRPPRAPRAPCPAERVPRGWALPGAEERASRLLLPRVERYGRQGHRGRLHYRHHQGGCWVPAAAEGGRGDATATEGGHLGMDAPSSLKNYGAFLLEL